MRRKFAFQSFVLLGIPLLGLGAAASPDEAFFRAAARGGMAEIEDGRLAQQKGGSQDVKDFGAMMVKDHTQAGEKLKTVAAAESVALPSSPSRQQVAGHRKLLDLSGAVFDRSYMRSQVKAHEETVALFKKEIASGQDGPARGFATETLPTIEAHLDKARSIYAALGTR